MKKMLVLVLVSVAFLAACSDSSGVPEIKGPELNISDLQNLSVDQLMINGGVNDDWGTPNFVVYLQNPITGSVVACAGAEEGLDIVQKSGYYYGKLDAEFVKVNGVEDKEESLSYKIVFVEKNGGACPEPISPNDDVVGTTIELSIGADGTGTLVNSNVYSTNGLATARLIVSGAEAGVISPMVSTLQKTLVLDQLYFTECACGEEATYELHLQSYGGDTISCKLGSADFSGVEAGTLYAGIDKAFDCVDAAEAGIFDQEFVVTLWRQIGDKTEIIGETEPTKLSVLLEGEQAFKEKKGYVSFRNIKHDPYDGTTMSLEEIEGMYVLGINHIVDVDGEGENMEVHIVDPVFGYSIACLSESNAGAKFVRSDGINELFGWESVKIGLVERGGSAACPDTLIDSDTTYLSGEIEIADIFDDTHDIFGTDGEPMADVTLGY